LLSFARQQCLAPKIIEINTVLRDLMSLVRPMMPERVHITVEPDADLWPCSADPTQLQSALLNLIINARDAFQDGGHITISARNAPRLVDDGNLGPGEYVLLSVEDDGSGMPPQVVAHAFEPFFTTKAVGKGSGLGLSMIYGFARQSGDAARIKSTEGRGTAIHLYLSRAKPIDVRQHGTICRWWKGTGSSKAIGRGCFHRPCVITRLPTLALGFSN
jgi:signal transduction histidine kinase